MIDKQFCIHCCGWLVLPMDVLLGKNRFFFTFFKWLLLPYVMYNDMWFWSMPLVILHVQKKMIICFTHLYLWLLKWPNQSLEQMAHPKAVVVMTVICTPWHHSWASSSLCCWCQSSGDCRDQPIPPISAAASSFQFFRFEIAPLEVPL